MSLCVLVTGGRNYRNHRHVFQVLDDLHRTKGVGLVVHGGASGADALAHLWAVERRVSVIPMAPDWKQYGRAAGPIRNRRMLADHLPDVVVAFPGGSGTQDMIEVAMANNVQVLQFAAPTPTGEPE